MGMTKVSRWVGACLLAAILPVLVACGGEGSTSTPDGSTGAGSPSPAAAATGPGNAAAGPDLGDPCTLLTQPELSTVFADGVPEPEGTSYGAGFAECVWEDAAERLVRLSVVPPENLKSDYIDQLVVRDGVVAEGSHANLWGVFGGDNFYGPLPVEMASFTATADGAVVMLAWETHHPKSQGLSP